MSDDPRIAAAKERLRQHYVPPAPSTNGKHATLEFGPDTRLSDDFWNTAIEPLGTHLRHIRDAALAQLVAPTAVLGAVLARISAGVHHSLMLPALVATPSPLCTFVLVIGEPGSGKGGASEVAVELLPKCANLEAVADCMPIGSPQGLIEIMYGTVPDPDDDKGKRMKRAQVRHNAYPILDEGAAIGGLGKDGGESLLATTCTLWSGKVAGQWNASQDLQRRLDASSYTYGIAIDVQPSSAASIMERDQLGAPQRYLFMAAPVPECGETDDDDVAHPGPLRWSPPEHHEIEHLEWDRNSFGWERRYLEVDPAIRSEVRAERRANAKRTAIGTTTERRLNEHRTLIKLRIAGLFSLMNGTYRITPELWVLAEHVVAVSVATRTLVESVNRTEVERRTEAQGRAQGYQEIAKRQVVEEDATAKAASKIVAKVRSGVTVWRDIEKSVRGANKAVRSWAVEEGWITVTKVPTTSRNGKSSEALALGAKAPR